MDANLDLFVCVDVAELTKWISVSVGADLADVDAGVLLIVSPVAQRQSKLLLAILSAQFHFLCDKHTHTHTPTLFRTDNVNACCELMQTGKIPEPYNFMDLMIPPTAD